MRSEKAALMPDDLSRPHYSDAGHIFLNITRNCNQNCAYCYLGDGDWLCREMSKEYSSHIGALFKKAGFQYVTISGGEPTLHPNFVYIVREYSQQGYHVIINTNGSIKAPLLSRLIQDNILYLSVSLDAPTESLNDFLRTKGSFRNAINTIELAIKLGIRIRVSPVIGYHNINLMSEFFEFLHDLGVDLVNIHRLTPVGNGSRVSAFVVSPSDWHRFVCNMRDNPPTINIRVPPVFITPDEISSIRYCGYNGCEAHTGKVVNVFPNGCILTCGILQDDTYMEYDLDSFTAKSVGEYATLKKCKGCQYRLFCCNNCIYHVKHSISHLDCTRYILLCPLWKVSVNSLHKAYARNSIQK